MGTNMLAKDAGAQLTGDVVRRGGADRYETAVELSKNQFSSGVEVADIATGTTFPDALVAGPGAGSRGPGGRQSDTRGGEPGAGAPAASTDRRSGRTSHRERWRHDLAQGVQREHRQTLRGRPLRNGRRDIQGPVRPRGTGHLHRHRRQLSRFFGSWRSRCSSGGFRCC
jgi:ell wall binding domain 2 (CWB2)